MEVRNTRRPLDSALGRSTAIQGSRPGRFLREARSCVGCSLATPVAAMRRNKFSSGVPGGRQSSGSGSQNAFKGKGNIALVSLPGEGTPPRLAEACGGTRR